MELSGSYFGIKKDQYNANIAIILLLIRMYLIFLDYHNRNLDIEFTPLSPKCSLQKELFITYHGKHLTPGSGFFFCS